MIKASNFLWRETVSEQVMKGTKIKQMRYSTAFSAVFSNNYWSRFTLIATALRRHETKPRRWQRTSRWSRNTFASPSPSLRRARAPALPITRDEPPVDRATLVNLARGCNPGRLVSEWRHWRSLDGQLTLAAHPRVIGRPPSLAARWFLSQSKEFSLHPSARRPGPSPGVLATRARGAYQGPPRGMAQPLRAHKFIYCSALLP